MSFLLFGKTKIPFKLRYSTKAKRLHIKVQPERVEVVAPLKTQRSVIETFVHQNRRWIEKKKTELDEKVRNRPLPHVIPLISGTKIPFRGTLIGLTVFEEGKEKTPQVRHEQDILVTLPRGTTTAGKEATVKKALKAWFLEHLRIEVEKISEHYSRILQARPAKIRFRRQKTRWGSCSSKGSINLNWHLVFVPQPILEYVVVHELCHLRHLNHSPQFWGAGCQADSGLQNPYPVAQGIPSRFSR